MNQNPTRQLGRAAWALAALLGLAACSGGGGGSESASASPGLSLVAGTLGSSGFLDGSGSTARLGSPHDVTADDAGNAYLIDGYAIRRVSAQGVVSTLLKPSINCAGHDVDGPAATACVNGWFNAITRDSAGNLYVSNTSSSTIRKFTPEGVISTFAGKNEERGAVDGPLATARLNWPTGMAFGGDGSLFFSDSNTVRQISPAGIVSTLAGQSGVSGSTDGAGAAARFVGPQGVAVDAGGTVYVVDGSETVRKINPAGVVSTLANTKAAGCPYARNLVVDPAGYLFVSSQYSICKISPAGVVSLFAGGASQGNADGMGPAARFENATGIAFDSAGRLLVTDEWDGTLRRITADGNVTRWVGSSSYGGYTDGNFVQARFFSPAGITADAAGNLYVADRGNHSIRKLAGGQVTTLAGSVDNRTVIDGVGAAAGFYDPRGITVDAQGNVFVADTYRHVIRKITPQGVTTTFAGAKGEDGHVDATGGAARLAYPNDVVADAAGNLYVTDRNNYGIRKITPSGAVTTLAGGGRGTSDGTGAAASFDEPAGIAIDSAGNLYVADTGLVRKVTPAGVVSTLAGGGPEQLGRVDGQGASARFERYLNSLSVDADGNVYAADQYNGLVRKITPGGMVSTLVGVLDGFSGVVPGMLPARLNAPYGVHVVGRTLYITDEHAVLSVLLP